MCDRSGVSSGPTVTPRTDVPFSAGELNGAVRATYAAFVATGLTFASWASRIPQVRDRLGLSPSGLGLVLRHRGRLGDRAAHVGDDRRPLRVPGNRDVDVGAHGRRVAGIALGSRVGVLPLAIALFFSGFAMARGTSR